MKIFSKIILPSALILLLGACQSSVRTDIQTYRNETAGIPAAGTVYIKPASGEEHVSLEFEFYKKKLAGRLKALGLEQTENKQADYLATLGYAVSRQEKDEPSKRVFISGYYGYAPYPGRGMVTADTYGSDFEYLREVSLTLDKNTQQKAEAKDKIVQVIATSEGECQHLSVVYDEILDAIFSNLWRANGSLMRMTVKGEAKCF
ncbi:hypothetical protein TDB9533_02413 [Thalassocella blandensis]|nr:hypothetical protein TDB9533_02413 [Thalassocella blandensis]